MLMLMLAGLGPRSVSSTRELEGRQHPTPPCEPVGLSRQAADEREKPLPPRMDELIRSQGVGVGDLGLGDVFSFFFVFPKKTPSLFSSPGRGEPPAGSTARCFGGALSETLHPSRAKALSRRSVRPAAAACFPKPSP